MKVALIGATGFVGAPLLQEFISRGHEVVAIARNIEKIPSDNDLIIARQADVLNTEEVAKAVAGVDAVVSAYNPGWTNPDIYDEYLRGAASIQSGVKQAGVKRFLVIGGAGSLEVAPGLQLIDTPEFPEEYKAGAGAARKYQGEIKAESELDWTYLSPAIEMHPGTSGKRTAAYRTSLDTPVFNENGRSIISVEDLSVAVVDEIENPKHINERFTVAY
ncbi:NAD(P)-dependent oxidoreductase [Dyadobacter sp. CY347]|uniref:NAD(P)-dependent oxidoreductase n=1 Tax=Dyadobacter sp. CY347 TaxID=2909336 RepID=UPI001F446853|nr:NAD(P)-dependent oxidoreductase [Dyadobacter sp. CY347]MCF2491354.1 NAD(P)-dependent oxidoreductase [Dyadobacter sp. CY347]